MSGRLYLFKNVCIIGLGRGDYIYIEMVHQRAGSGRLCVYRSVRIRRPGQGGYTHIEMFVSESRARPAIPIYKCLYQKAGSGRLCVYRNVCISEGRVRAAISI